MNISDKNEPLAVVVCGYEQGGTTLVSQILRQHPTLDSGFECGFLLTDDVSHFLTLEPYCTITKAGWDLTDDDLSFICQSQSWPGVYQRLRDRSKLITDKSAWLIDKTPKYMEVLSDVLIKVPNVPCIVVVRDPRAVIWSWTKRLNPNPEGWTNHYLSKCCERYMSYACGWEKASQVKDLSNRILLVQYESICKNSIAETSKMFKFTNREFKETFLSFENEYKFPNVRHDRISSQYLDEYKRNFPEEVCQKILEKTKKFSSWFWEES